MINKEKQIQIINDYLYNLSIKEIISKHDVCRNSITNILNKNNITIRNFRTPKKIEKLIIDEYKNGCSNKDLCDKYLLHRSTIQSILIRNGVNLRPKKITARKHQIINENIFQNIDNENSAYILGLLFADGSIRKNGFEISLVEGDVELLENISMILYGKKILSYIKSKLYKNTNYMCKGQYRLVVASDKIRDDLIKHGCVPAKTFKIKFPNLNDDVYSHFIRGYFDGDGSFIKSSTRNYLGVNITSNLMFCEGLCEYLKNRLNIDVKLSIRYGDVGAVRIHKKNDVFKFIDFIYRDSTIYLNRKYEKSKL